MIWGRLARSSAIYGDLCTKLLAAENCCPKCGAKTHQTWENGIRLGRSVRPKPQPERKPPAEFSLHFLYESCLKVLIWCLLRSKKGRLRIKIEKFNGSKRSTSVRKSSSSVGFDPDPTLKDFNQKCQKIQTNATLNSFIKILRHLRHGREKGYHLAALKCGGFCHLRSI